jgi:hypothetical protein
MENSCFSRVETLNPNPTGFDLEPKPWRVRKQSSEIRTRPSTLNQNPKGFDLEVDLDGELVAVEHLLERCLLCRGISLIRNTPPRKALQKPYA